MSPTTDVAAAAAAAEALIDSTPVDSSRLSEFSHLYARAHGYVSLFVCILGVISNVFIVIVLTRKVMVNPTSRILTALAVSDLLTMSSYIPFAYHFYVLHRPDTSHEVQRNGIGWMSFFLVHVHLSVTAHTISIWLGVLLSFYRYSYVRDPSNGSLIGAIGCSPNVVSYTIGAVYALSIVAMIPNYMSLQIVRLDVTHNDSAAVQSNRTVIDYDVVGTETDVIVAKQTPSVEADAAYYDIMSVDVTDAGRGVLITRINFWIHALLVKLLPCALMSVFGLLIVCAVRSTHRKGSMLRKNSTRTDTVTLRRRESNRTTSMLVAVIVLFLVTELPQGVLALLSGIVDGFFETYYTPLGDLMDIVALINNGINFTLYCSMSDRFRRTFVGLFCRTCHLHATDNGSVDIRREMVTLRTIMLSVNARDRKTDSRRILTSN